jgi:hypothetical protein
MSGYSGFAMSNNAVLAYGEGLAPASKIKGVPAVLVRKFCRAVEWHHSSKAYNRVNFYNVDEVHATFGLVTLDEYSANDLAIAALTSSKIEAAVTHTNCLVKWIEWGGTLKRPIAKERTESACVVIVKGQTATIELSNGTKITKRVTTRGFSFKEIKS